MSDNRQMTVVKSNKIIEAGYRLTTAEQRILLACIAQIDSKGEIPEGRRFEVTVSQIEDLAGISNGYAELQAASVRLLKRIVKIDAPDPERPNLAFTLTHWVDSCDYFVNEGRIELGFSRLIAPYLSQLSRNFTQYKLQNVARMRSSYSVRLYELLCQWQSVGEKEVAVTWLREQWQIEGEYPRMFDFKRKVIDVAVKEVNEHSNLWVEYGVRKQGRMVVAFQFKFGLKSEDNPTKKNKPLTDVEIASAARPGETTAQVIARLTGNDLAKIAKPGETTEQAIQRKKALAEAKEKLGRSKK